MSNTADGKSIMDALKEVAKKSKGSSINELILIFALERAVAQYEIIAIPWSERIF